jgi:hypothetical protein
VNPVFLAYFAFNGINNLRAFNVAFSSIPTAPTNHPFPQQQLSDFSRRQATLRPGQLVLLRQQPVVSWWRLLFWQLLSAFLFSRLSCLQTLVSEFWPPSWRPPSISVFEPLSSLLRFGLWALENLS